MTEAAARASGTEELLFERERRGLRTMTLVRGLYVVLLSASVMVIGVNRFEKLATAAIAVLVLLAVAGFLVLLAKRKAVRTVGLLGCLIDIAVIATLPVVWYHSVGGAEVPPAYMLKTHLTLISLVVVALNGLAIRPLYPLVVTAGALAVHGAILIHVLGDPRTLVSSDYRDSALGPAISLELVLIAMLLIAIVGLVMGALTRIARRTVVEGVRLEVANARLGRYFSPGVVERVADEGLEGLGGRTQEVAVLFSDIQGFTGLTEPLSPAEAVELLSQYHARMVAEVFGFGGTLDKFIGDAIMATFGTPDPSPDDAERAVRAALAMNRALAELNREREARCLPTLRHRIGIHYGPVIAGNIGTETRLEYTVIGDTVNVASRIEGACKSLGETLLVSEAVARRLPPDIRLRPLAEQPVEGRRAPVELFAVEGEDR